MEIDYRANAVHALDVLMKHDPKLIQAEKDILTFVVKILEKKLDLTGVNVGYSEHVRTLTLVARDTFK